MDYAINNSPSELDAPSIPPLSIVNIRYTSWFTLDACSPEGPHLFGTSASNPMRKPSGPAHPNGNETQINNVV